MVAAPRELLPALRPMTEADLTEVARIEAAAYAFPWTIGIFRDCLRAGYHAWVLARPGTIYGYGMLSIAAGEAHLLNLCIDPVRQGEGHGRHLLARLIDLARWHRAERIFLEVRPSNAAAIALYHDMGFNEIGRRPNYYPAHGGREDAQVMALELLAPER
jgi:ribosomal-protein-alanine N-acetyltransferase